MLCIHKLEWHQLFLNPIFFFFFLIVFVFVFVLFSNSLAHTINGISRTFKFEPAHDKSYKMTCAPSEDSDQPGHPLSLIRVFAVRMKKA